MSNESNIQFINTKLYAEIEDLKDKIKELEQALLWSRDRNTGFEPSLSVMQRYYDDLPQPQEVK